jgi:hypothetical protein
MNSRGLPSLLSPDRGSLGQCRVRNEPRESAGVLLRATGMNSSGTHIPRSVLGSVAESARHCAVLILLQSARRAPILLTM